MTTTLHEIVQDLKFAARYAYRTRLTTLTMVAVLSLGIGVNAALFTVIHSITGKPAPGIPPNDALVRLRGPNFSYASFQDIAKRRDVFDHVAVSLEESAVVEVGAADATGESTIEANVNFVTSEYFRALGVPMETGRGLPSDSGADRRADNVVVIDFVLWRDRFGKRADVVGQKIKINNIPVSIVGVAPRGFAGHDGGNSRVVWMPLGAVTTIVGVSQSLYDNRKHQLFDGAIARLHDGASMETASNVVLAVALRDMEVRPSSRGMPMPAGVTRRTGPIADAAPLRTYNRGMGEDSEMYKIIGMFVVLTLLVLLVTCTNVASLLAGAGLTRRREIAVRLSLGAPRTRIVRQLVTESVLVALMASVVALSLLWTAIRVLGNMSPDVAFSPDWPSILFTGALAILTAVGFALSPALHATRMSVGEALKNTATNVASKSRLQRGFVVAQITLTQPLLVLLGVMIAAILSDAQRFHRNPLGDRILHLSYSYVDDRGPDQSPPTVPGAARQLSPRTVQTRAVAERLKATPGVSAVIESGDYRSSSLHDVHPADGARPNDDDFRVQTVGVHPGYFEMMGWPLVAGRDVTAQEIEAQARVMIIRSDLARQLWGSVNPVGKRLRRLPFPFRHGEGGGRSMDTLDVTIIGVVDAKRAGPSRRGGDGGSESAFEPARGTGYSMYMRTTALAEPFIPTVRAISKETAPRLVLRSISTVAKEQDSLRNSLLMAGAVAGTCGAIMLGLACIGLYAVIAFAVGQRTREIGIRIALGQGEASVVGMFLKSGMLLCILGLLIGIPLTMLGLKLAVDVVLIPDIPRQIPAIVGVVIVVALVSAVAILIPARRAVTVNPLVALRAE